MTDWLITGGCGFIGRNLIKNLLAEGGHFIRVIDNLKVGTRDDLSMVCNWIETPPENVKQPANSAKNVELIVEDILNPELARSACKGFDVIVHLAANTGVAPSVEDPRMDCVTNIIGTLNYLEAARHNRVKRFIFASSGAPAGAVEPPIHEEMAPHPVSPYGASKLAGEGYCSAYYRTFGVETVALRFGNAYGPLSCKKASVVARFIKQAMEGKQLEIYGDGEQTRDFIYIDDLIHAIRLSASQEGIGGEVFQIATNAETTVKDLVQLLLAILEKKGISKVKFRHAAPRTGDVMRNFSDTSKAMKMLKWRAETTLRMGIEYTVDWFINFSSPNSFR